MAKDIQQLERVQRRAARFVKKITAVQLLSLVCLTNFVGCPCSNVANILVWRFSTRSWITFQPFLWITFQFHHGILETPMKINLCHCQFVLMLLNIHFFLGPLPIGIPSHWLFAARSRFSLSMEVCWARHPPITADHYDTPAVTGGLHPLLDISLKNWRSLFPRGLSIPISSTIGLSEITKSRICGIL